MHQSCVEPYEPKTSTFEDVIVIEATITNEYKHQLISISRTRQFEDYDINNESNATVQIIDSNNNTYNFNESSPGKYYSNIEFSVQPNINYQLFITTSNGDSYSSAISQLPAISQIDDLYAVRETNNQGEEGIYIYIDSYNPLENSFFYRYTYEETYKIVAPFWSAYDGKIDINPLNFEMTPYLVLKDEEQRICYNTVSSNNINLLNINEYNNHHISEFPVRFIKRNNFIISHRYSILVKQYIQSEGANNYYKILDEISSSGGVFSQTQTGYNPGNITSVNNPDEKVIGYFDVSSVTEQRLYFNYNDLFPNEDLPPYPTECTEYTPLLNDPLRPGPEFSPLLRALSSKKYFKDNEFSDENQPWVMVPSKCGDCRSFGSNIAPDFWIE